MQPAWPPSAPKPTSSTPTSSTVVSGVGRSSSRKSRSFRRRERSETASTSFIRATVPPQRRPTARAAPYRPSHGRGGSVGHGRGRRHADRALPARADVPERHLARRAPGRLAAAALADTATGAVVVRAPSEEALATGPLHARARRRHVRVPPRASPRDPLLGPTVRALVGYRPLRLATVAHAALRAMCGQLIESRRARAIERVDPAAARRRPSRRATTSSGSRRAELRRARARDLARRDARSTSVRSLDLERLRDARHRGRPRAPRPASAGSGRGRSA